MLDKVKVDHVLMSAMQRKLSVAIKTTPNTNREAMEALKSIVLVAHYFIFHLLFYITSSISLFLLARLIAKFMGCQYVHISENANYFGR